MKPIQIGLLVVAGALAGALVMKWQSSRQAAPAEVSAQALPAVPARPISETTPAQAVTPAEQVPEPPAAAAPAAAPAPAPLPDRTKPRPAVPARKPVAAVIAQNDGPARPPITSKEPDPEPVPPAPVAPPMPPARPAPPAPVQEPAREPAPPPAPNQVTLAANTLIPVRLVDGLTTERNVAGDLFVATLDAPLVVDGFVIAERGARVEGKVVDSVKAAKGFSGISTLSIVITRINLSDGQKLAVETQSFTKKGPNSKGEDAAKVGGGAGIGAVIGAIAGGGKGAAIGAGVGGAAGAGDVMLTHGKPATLPSETRINFRLASAVTVTERR